MLDRKIISSYFEGTKEKRFVELLEKAGYEAYFVGGCVRDLLLSFIKKEPVSFNDIDISTSATPEETQKVLQSIAHMFDFVGKNYGVLIADGVEIAQFRSETYNHNGDGKPVISLVRSLSEDARRRDFTINALYINSTGDIIDPYNGLKDLKNGIIRAIDNPLNRFREDASRILRMFYLAARLNFKIDKNTLSTAMGHKELLYIVPEELKGKILKKVIHHNCLSTYITLVKDAGMLDYVLPELSYTPNMPQNPKYHHLDVFEHIMEVVRASEKTYPSNTLYALASLFHDNAKGLEGVRGINKEGQPNDLGHEEKGVIPATKAMIRLQFGRELADEVAFIIKYHGLRLPYHPKRKSVVNALRKMAKDCKNKEQLKERVDKLFNFMLLDAQGFQPAFNKETTELLIHLRPIFLQVLEEQIFFTHELPINGNDLIQLGFPKGKIIGNVLSELVIMNIKDRETALRIAERRLEQLQ